MAGCKPAPRKGLSGRGRQRLRACSSRRCRRHLTQRQVRNDSGDAPCVFWFSPPSKVQTATMEAEERQHEVHADEESHLLDHSQKHRHKSPAHLKRQLAIIMLLQICSPITSQSIYPYINQVCGLLSDCLGSLTPLLSSYERSV